MSGGPEVRSDEDLGTADAARPARTWADGVDLVLVAIVVAGLVVRGVGLGAQSLWYDEWLTSEAVAGSLPDVLRHVADREGIPPTFFLLQWMWVQVAGDSEGRAPRALPALFGAATVPVAYAVVVELRQPRLAARAAALLVAVSPMLVWYSQEARPYSLIAFLGGLSFLLFVRVWRDGADRDLAVWAAVGRRHRGGALLRSVPHRGRGAGACSRAGPACGVGWCWRRCRAPACSRSWRRWRRPSTRTPPTGCGSRGSPSATDSRRPAARPSSDRSPFDDRLWIAVAAVVAVAGLLLVVTAGPAARSAAALAATIGGAALVPPVVLAVVGGDDVVIGRYLIASLVPLLVAVAIGLASGPRAVALPALAVVSAVSLVVVAGVVRDPDLQKPDWSAVAATSAGDGSRALVLNVHRVIASPLVDEVSGGATLEGDDRALVDEVAVVHSRPSTAPCNHLVGRACALIFLGAPLPDQTASQLELVERVELDQFVVERYRPTDGPIDVSRADLVAPQNLADALVVVSSG